MKFSVPANFDDEMIYRLSGYPVDELYGKLSSDYIGGGRASYLLSPITETKVEKHVKLARENKIGFNYLLNASCMNNLETTRVGQKKIRKTLDWISEIGCTAVTVSNPLLLRIIKKNYPNLKVRVSVFAQVDHILRAKFWEEMGADVIALSSQTVNREFRILKKLREKCNCDFELLVNGACNQSCAFFPSHGNLQAHGSQKKHKNNGFVIDYCALGCLKLKLKNPVNYIRSDWIRPEDLHHYEEMGYDRFKLVERNLPTDVIVKRVKAYAEGEYKGNLLDLFNYYGNKRSNKEKRWATKFFLKPNKVNPMKMDALGKLADMMEMFSGENPPIYIENEKLDGFINGFLKRSCKDLDCNDCRYCHVYAEKAVRTDPDFIGKCLDYYEIIDDLIDSGKLWKYY